MALLSFQMPVKMFEVTQCVEHEFGDHCMILLSELSTCLACDKCTMQCVGFLFLTLRNAMIVRGFFAKYR